MSDLLRLRRTERWIARVRLLAVPFAVVEVGFLSHDYPPGYERWAWLVTAVFGVGAIAAWLVAHRDLELRQQKILGFSALVLDTLVVASYVVIYYAYEPDTPVRSAGGPTSWRRSTAWPGRSAPPSITRRLWAASSRR